MADVYRDWVLYNVGKAIKNWTEYPFDWTMLTEYNQLNQQYIAYQWDMATIQANLRTSIQNKWVTVPANAAFNTYPSYVDQIDTSWWTAWLMWDKILRAGSFWVGRYQHIADANWWITYRTGNCVLFLFTFDWYEDDHDEHKISMAIAYPPNSNDYIQSYYDDDYVWPYYSWTSERGTLAWLRITESWNEVLLETCYWQWGNFYADTKYFFHVYCTYNKQTNTFWNWIKEYVDPAETTNPYFEWMIWDQWLYSIAVERLGSYDDTCTFKLTPTFN